MDWVGWVLFAGYLVWVFFGVGQRFCFGVFSWFVLCLFGWFCSWLGFVVGCIVMYDYFMFCFCFCDVFGRLLCFAGLLFVGLVYCVGLIGGFVSWVVSGVVGLGLCCLVWGLGFRVDYCCFGCRLFVVFG